jgi:SAM-dependent methyltransferase
MPSDGQRPPAEGAVSSLAFYEESLRRGARAPCHEYRGLPVYAEVGLHQCAAEVLGSHVKPPARVLDVACGSGAMSQRLLDLGYTVVATDVFEENFRLRDRVPFVRANLNENFHAAFEGRFRGPLSRAASMPSWPSRSSSTSKTLLTS